MIRVLIVEDADRLNDESANALLKAVEEAGYVHPTRKAKDHLLALALSNGIPRSRVPQVLELVGLVSQDRPHQAPDGLRGGIAGCGGLQHEVGETVFTEELSLR